MRIGGAVTPAAAENLKNSSRPRDFDPVITLGSARAHETLGYISRHEDWIAFPWVEEASPTREPQRELGPFRDRETQLRVGPSANRGLEAPRGSPMAFQVPLGGDLQSIGQNGDDIWLAGPNFDIDPLPQTSSILPGATGVASELLPSDQQRR